MAFIDFALGVVAVFAGAVVLLPYHVDWYLWYIAAIIPPMTFGVAVALATAVRPTPARAIRAIVVAIVLASIAYHTLRVAIPASSPSVISSAYRAVKHLLGKHVGTDEDHARRMLQLNLVVVMTVIALNCVAAITAVPSVLTAALAFALQPFQYFARLRAYSSGYPQRNGALVLSGSRWVAAPVAPATVSYTDQTNIVVTTTLELPTPTIASITTGDPADPGLDAAIIGTLATSTNAWNAIIAQAQTATNARLGAARATLVAQLNQVRNSAPARPVLTGVAAQLVAYLDTVVVNPSVEYQAALVKLRAGQPTMNGTLAAAIASGTVPVTATVWYTNNNGTSRKIHNVIEIDVPSGAVPPTAHFMINEDEYGQFVQYALFAINAAQNQRQEAMAVAKINDFDSAAASQITYNPPELDPNHPGHAAFMANHHDALARQHVNGHYARMVNMCDRFGLPQSFRGIAALLTR
jgi:hypothetical protein